MMEMLHLLAEQSSSAMLVGEVAERLGVQPRTVKRYADAIAARYDSGGTLPMVERVRRKGRSYLVLNRQSGNETTHNIYQYAVLHAAVRHLANLGDPDLQESGNLLLEKIGAGLSPVMRSRVERGFIYLPLAPCRAEATALAPILQAIAFRRPLVCRSRPGNGRETEEVLHPFTLIAGAAEYSIIGQRQGAKQVELFVLDNYDEMEVDRKGAFEVPTDYDPSAFLERTGRYSSDGEREDIEIAFTKKAVPRARARSWVGPHHWHAGDDGWEVLVVDEGLNTGLEEWVCSFGDGAEVLAPTWFRGRVSDALRRAAARYDTDA